MLGPPGSGKTMLAKRMPTILPDLTPVESIETTRIYSAVGRLRAGQPLLAVRPFRSPHHTISDAGLVGGGSTPAPGEISLSHNGVLFLDELPEFNRRTLEVLRQPLEDGTVTISRALSSTTFPANFMLIAALNPCPCGYRGDARRNCHCTPPQIERYMSKISGPAAGSHRHAHRGARGAVPRAFRGFAGHVERRDARAGEVGPACPGRPFRRHLDAAQRPHVAPSDAAVLPVGRRVPQPVEGGDDGAWPFGPRRTTRFCGSPGRSPTSTPATRSARIILTRRSTTGCWTGSYGPNCHANEVSAGYNSNMTAVPLADLTQSAIHVLCREIGVVNTARFLNQFSLGQGDYTQERQEPLGRTTVDEIVAEVKRQGQP